jgi:hypothetical protein
LTDSGEWLVEFKGRKASGTYDQNFLWKSGNVYVMDNHRAALWCWMQHIKPRKPHSIFHIDRHYDTLQSNMETWLPHFPKRWDISVEQYLDLSYQFEDDQTYHHPLFRYDNYLSLYLHRFKKYISTCYFVTHEDGDKPNYKGGFEEPPWDLLGNLDYWIDAKRRPWVLNIDLDYFFCDDRSDGCEQMLTDRYIETIFESARRTIDAGFVGVTTIALSPEYCGGWEAAERVMDIASAKLGINFWLPDH